ncbi:MAG: glycosyltransferase, partial [Bacteroidia bacterium]|nr:glycosyltransferase [Bacteroidia bacterium]
MQVSVIISYYKNLPALELLLLGLGKQSVLPMEVILAEDDNTPATAAFLKECEVLCPFPIVHLFQEVNDGFRKNEMLNRAVKAAKSNLVAFLDGDCIPHKHWLKNCIEHTQPKHPVFGRRVMVSPKLTTKMYASKNLKDLNFCSYVFSGSKRIKYSLYLPFTPIKPRGGM